MLIIYISVDSLTISKDSIDDIVSINMNDNTLQVSKLRFRWDYILVYIMLKFLQGSGVGETIILLKGLTLNFFWND